MSVQNYVLDGEPVSGKNHMQIRHRRDGRAFIGKSSVASQWQLDAIGQLVLQRTRLGYKMVRGECSVQFRAYQRRKRDLDNIASSLFDALKKAKVIEDDMDITHLTSSKITDPTCEPRIEVTVTPLPPAQ